MEASRRVALVTGCGKAEGIGAVAALALARAGMAVAVADVAEGGTIDLHEVPSAAGGGIAALVATINAEGGAAVALIGDISIEADADRLVAQTIEHFGRLDVLVNNAAAPMGADRVNVVDVPLAAWRRVLDINLTGTFLMCRAAIRVMREQRSGRIINVASAVMDYPMDRMAAYASSKAGIGGLTRALAADAARFGITVNAIAPGTIATSRVTTMVRRVDGDVAKGLAARAAGIPLGRMGEPEELAAVIAFLASEASSYVTGQVWKVDGGGLGMPHVSAASMPVEG